MLEYACAYVGTHACCKNCETKKEVTAVLRKEIHHLRPNEIKSYACDCDCMHVQLHQLMASHEYVNAYIRASAYLYPDA